MRILRANADDGRVHALRTSSETPNHSPAIDTLHVRLAAHGLRARTFTDTTKAEAASMSEGAHEPTVG